MSRTRTFVLAGLVVVLAGGVIALKADQATKPYVPPVKGQAIVGYLQPQTKRVGKEIVTVIKVKNMNTGRLAGLKVDEFWFDKAQNPVTGATYRHPKPMEPGGIITITLKTPDDPRMSQNTYNFSHANGTVKATRMKTLDEPSADGKKDDGKKKK